MSLRVGNYEIFSVDSGHVRLDGGAMFGVVPKTLWEKKIQADEKNRILLSMRNLIAVNKAEKRLVLVDTGAGRKWNSKELDIYAFEFQGDPLIETLAKLGYQPSDVTDIVVTHLHFDHNGGLTEFVSGSAEKTRPRFPKARHWIHQKHYDHAIHPNEKDRASFLVRDWESVLEAGLFKFLEGEPPPSTIPGIRWFLSHGHTPWQLLPVFEDKDHSLMFCGDLIPTSAHLPVPWIMGYDNQPLVIMNEKKKILQEATDRNLILAFEHDVQVAACQVVSNAKGKPEVGKVYEL